MDDEQAQGWLLFAVIVLVTAGIMGILDAIWAWRCGGVLDRQQQHPRRGDDVTSWRGISRDLRDDGRAPQRMISVCGVSRTPHTLRESLPCDAEHTDHAGRGEEPPLAAPR